MHGQSQLTHLRLRKHVRPGRLRSPQAAKADLPAGGCEAHREGECAPARAIPPRSRPLPPRPRHCSGPPALAPPPTPHLSPAQPLQRCAPAPPEGLDGTHG